MIIFGNRHIISNTVYPLTTTVELLQTQVTERVKGLLCKAQGQPPLQQLLKHSHSLLRWRKWHHGREERRRPHVLVLLSWRIWKGRCAWTRCQNVFLDS